MSTLPEQTSRTNITEALPPTPIEVEAWVAGYIAGREDDMWRTDDEIAERAVDAACAVRMDALAANPRSDAVTARDEPSTVEALKRDHPERLALADALGDMLQYEYPDKYAMGFALLSRLAAQGVVVRQARAASASVPPPLDVERLAKALALIHVTGHPIKEAIEHWESYRSDATEIIAAYGACGDLPEYAAETQPNEGSASPDEPSTLRRLADACEGVLQYVRVGSGPLGDDPAAKAMREAFDAIGEARAATDASGVVSEASASPHTDDAGSPLGSTTEGLSFGPMPAGDASGELGLRDASPASAIVTESVTSAVPPLDVERR